MAPSNPLQGFDARLSVDPERAPEPISAADSIYKTAHLSTIQWRPPPASAFFARALSAQGHCSQAKIAFYPTHNTVDLQNQLPVFIYLILSDQPPSHVPCATPDCPFGLVGSLRDSWVWSEELW